MKKKITLLTLLICSLSYAQDIGFLHQLDHTTIPKSEALAANIAIQTAQDFVLYKTIEKKDLVSFVYIPATIKKEAFNYHKQGNKALVIEFNIYKSRVALDRIVAPYNDLLSVWQHYFKEVPNLDDYTSRKVKVNGIAFRIDKDTAFQDNVWQIQDTM